MRPPPCHFPSFCPQGVADPQKTRRHVSTQATPACKIWRESARGLLRNRWPNKQKKHTVEQIPRPSLYERMACNKKLGVVQRRCSVPLKIYIAVTQSHSRSDCAVYHYCGVWCIDQFRMQYCLRNTNSRHQVYPRDSIVIQSALLGGDRSGLITARYGTEQPKAKSKAWHLLRPKENSHRLQGQASLGNYLVR